MVLVTMTIFLGLTLGATVVWMAVPELWFLFRWHVLGSKPAILVEHVVKKTVADCVPAGIAELAGHEVAGEEKRQRIERLIQEVILRYTQNFCVYLSEGPSEKEEG
jgi:hypothetical protein